MVMRLPWSTRNSRLDLSHPLLRGCYAYFTLGNDGRNLIPSGVEDAVAANGATFMSAKAGRLSAALDGVNDSLQVAAHSSLDQGGTWSYWINTSGAWGTDGGSGGGLRGAGIVLSRAQSASSANGVLMLISNAGLPIFVCKKAGGTEVVNIVSTKSVTDGRWHHVAASFGLASGAAARLYVDGTQVASGSNSDAFSFSTSEPLYIGDSADTWWEEMIGNVSDVALFSRVVSPAEIRGLSDRPWKVFARNRKPRAGGSTGVTLDCTVGNAVAAGAQANISAGTTINASVGNAAAAGSQANISAGTTINASVGNAVAEGAQASITSGTTLDCTVGNAVAAGAQATISAGTTINAGVGNAVAAGVQASITTGFTLECTVGNAVAAGVQAGISIGSGTVTIACAVGNAVAAGVDVDIWSADPLLPRSRRIGGEILQAADDDVVARAPSRRIGGPVLRKPA